MSDSRVSEWFPELALVSDAELRGQIIATWEAALALATVPDPSAVPFALAAPGESLHTHIRLVTKNALALAEVIVERGHPPLDRDLLLAACLLHDVDKLLMVEPDGAEGFRGSSNSRRLGHGVLGAMLCREQGLPEEVVHLVVTHTARSPLPPEPFEGVVLHYADFLAADSAFYEVGERLLMHR